MPDWLLAVLVVGGSALVAAAVHQGVRRRVSLEVLREHQEVASVLLALVGGTYGVLLAFVTVAVWDDFELARHNTAREGNAAANLYRLAEGLPPEARARLQGAVDGYFRAVVEEEWPRMAEDASSPRAARQMEEVWRAVVDFAPRDVREGNLQLTALEEVRELRSQRRTRLVLSEQRLPPLLWGVLLTGALVTLGFVNLFGLRYRRSEMAMTAATAAVLALALFTIAALNRPFAGPVRVPPAHLQEIHGLLREG